MKLKKKALFAFTISILFVFFMTPQGYSGTTKGVTDTTIKIGGIFSLTGPTVATIKPWADAHRNYTRHVNDQGGILGRKIKLIIEDDRYTIPAAVAAFKKLIYRDQIFALLGPGSTGETRALMDQMMKEKIPSIPYAADRDVIEPYKRYLFLPLDTYDNQIGIILGHILETSKPNKPRIALACLDAGVKAAVLRGINKWSKFYGVDIQKIMLPLSAMDTTSEVLTMKRAKIDHVIVVHTVPTAALILKDSKRFGLKAKFIGTYSVTTEDVVRMAGDEAKNFFGVHPYSSWYDDSPGMAELREITLKYHPGTEKPYRNKNYSGGWVGIELLFEGIKRAGKSLDREKLITAMETIENYDTKGICGPITYTSKSHEGLKYDKVFQGDPATGKLVPITDWKKAPEIR